MAAATRKGSLPRRLVRAACEPALIADKAGAYLARWRKSRLDLENERRASLAFLSAVFARDAAAIAAEYRHSPFRAWFLARHQELATRAGEQMNTSLFDLETLYILIRLARPRTVVETGVLYGASSGHILEALRRNGTGRLYSIDLPGPDARLGADFLVPKDLRYHWQLTYGDSRDELPGLLRRLGQIDCFFHDSLHTYDHMLWEYATAYLYLGAGGVLASHDVVAGLLRNPFADFCRRHWLTHGVFRNVGIAVLPEGPLP